MNYVNLKTTYWTDADIEELSPEGRYFYLYLLTNPRINQIGLYEFSINHAALELGYNKETVEKLLQHFQKIKKIKRSKTSKEIVICKFFEHNKTRSPKLEAHCNKLLKEVKDTLLIPYIYGIDTLLHKTKQNKTNSNTQQTTNTDTVSNGLDLDDVDEFILNDLGKEVKNPILQLQAIGIEAHGIKKIIDGGATQQQIAKVIFDARQQPNIKNLAGLVIKNLTK